MPSSNKDTFFNFLDLYSKPPSYKFNKEEIELIKEHMPKTKYTIKYCIWKQHRMNGKYILFVIENCSSTRKSAFEHSIEVICTREITDIEYQEEIENMGCNNRRFEAWSYATIDQLIEADKRYQVKTPQIFIDRCKRNLVIEPKYPKKFG